MVNQYIISIYFSTTYRFTVGLLCLRYCFMFNIKIGHFCPLGLLLVYGHCEHRKPYNYLNEFYLQGLVY
jgi:hypothetical protein